NTLACRCRHLEIKAFVPRKPAIEPAEHRLAVVAPPNLAEDIRQFLMQPGVNSFQQMMPHDRVGEGAERQQHGGQRGAEPQGHPPADCEPRHHASLNTYPTPRTVKSSCRRSACSIFRRSVLTYTSMTLVRTPAGSFQTSRAIMSRVTVAFTC